VRYGDQRGDHAAACAARGPARVGEQALDVLFRHSFPEVWMLQNDLLSVWNISRSRK
jgi:hypothetical protein